MSADAKSYLGSARRQFEQARERLPQGSAAPLSSRVTSPPDATSLVFIVDDDVSVRESLELLIHSAGWIPVMFTSAQEFLEHPRHLVPSCLILDLAMPGLNGLELQKIIAAERPDMPIIFVTGYGDVPATVQAMKAGAVEFLTKPIREDVLLEAIEKALERSRSALPHEVLVNALRGRYASLSRREREVMLLVVAGLLNKQVGGELGISEITVKAHRGNVMRKMQADSLPDLVNMSAQLGLPGPAQSASGVTLGRHRRPAP